MNLLSRPFVSPSCDIVSIIKKGRRGGRKNLSECLHLETCEVCTEGTTVHEVTEHKDGLHHLQELLAVPHLLRGGTQLLQIGLDIGLLGGVLELEHEGLHSLLNCIEFLDLHRE